MLIGIHALAAFKKNKTGVEKYSAKLIENMAMLPEAREHLFVLYTNPPNFELQITNYDNFTTKVLKSPFLWTQARLAAHFILKKPNAFFAPAHVLPILFRPKNSTVVVHDIAFELFPETYPQRHRSYLQFTTKYALKHAKKIIVPSENTKKDILRFYKPADEKKIFVIHHGMNKLQASRLKLEDRGFDFPYFLYIGRLELKKNILGILRAFDSFKGEHKSSHKLVLVGDYGFGGDTIKEVLSKYRYRNDIITMGFVDEDRKNNLLASADVFLYPSLYEGFGFPILEAQSFDVPVITSCISSMPEIAGQGAILVDPHNTEEIKDAMIRVLADESLRNNLIKKGAENLKRFSWQSCARQTLKIITQ